MTGNIATWITALLLTPEVSHWLTSQRIQFTPQTIYHYDFLGYQAEFGYQLSWKPSMAQSTNIPKSGAEAYMNQCILEYQKAVEDYQLPKDDRSSSTDDGSTTCFGSTMTGYDT
jgi:hypothetical protein